MAFALGGIVPLLATVLAPASVRLGATVAAVVVALIITGYLSAAFGRATKLHAVGRVIAGGAIAMIVTYGVGHIFGRIIS